MDAQLNRSPRAIVSAGLAFAPLALGIQLPVLGVDVRILGVAAVFVALLQMRRSADGSTTLVRSVVGLSLLAYAFRLIALWPSEFTWLDRMSSAGEFVALIGYLLLTRAGIALARSHGDRDLERSWQACAWIGAPLFLLPAAFLTWVSLSGSNHFESHNLLVMMAATVVLSLPAVLLLHAVFATRKALTVAAGTPVRLPLRVLAHRRTAVVMVLLFLAPSLLLVPSAIHFATTPRFDEFVTHRSAVVVDPPAGIRILERHPGLLHASDTWIDIGNEDREQKAERVGYGFSLELTRPGATLLKATNSLSIKVEAERDEDFRELRVNSEIEAVDPRFRLALTVFLDRSRAAGPVDNAAVPTLDFLVQVALLAGAGETMVDTAFVDGLESMPLMPVAIGSGALSYIWQARGRFQLLRSCRQDDCLSGQVWQQREQRFDLATEEYSYAMKASLTTHRETRGPGAQSEFNSHSDSKQQSKATSWNDVPW